MLSKRLVKQHRELQETLERLFNPNVRLDPRTRRALELRADSLFDCVEDLREAVLEERVKLQRLVGSRKKRQV